jgi:isoleucyl-tRNA synthetase
MAPILSFTADEVWEYLPGQDRPASVHLAALPSPPAGFPDEALLAKYDFLLKVRGEINRRLEEARKNKVLATVQEARIELWISDDNLYRKLLSHSEELRVLAQAPELSVIKQLSPMKSDVLEAEEMPGLIVIVEKAAEEKCVRCWFRYPGVGEDPKHPQICRRCRQVLEP